MLDLKTFLKQKINVFFTILYTTIFIVVNVVFFFTNNAYITDTIDRENTSLVEMIEHLITYTGEDNALVFLEHYGHTHSVYLTLRDTEGITEFETPNAPNNAKRYLVEVDEEAYGYLYVDNDQSEVVSKNATYLLVFNAILIGIYVVGLLLFSAYFKKYYGVIIDDMNKIQSKLQNIDHQYQYTFSEIATISEKFDEKIKRIRDLQKSHKLNVQSLAHDIKTPLTILKSTIEAVEQGRIELTKEVSNSLLEEINAMDTLIPRLIESTKENTREKIELSQEVVKACKRQEPLFEDKGIVIKVALDEGVNLHMDRELVHRIVDHLLSNVRMHAKGVKEVQVSIDSSSKSLVITDDGEGISLKAMEIFNKKTAAFPSSNKGSGLGLSIVKDIIEQYGGSLEIEALKPRGTRVTIFFSS